MEEWRDIPGYEGLYQVSNLGNVKSVTRYVRNKAGMRVINEHILAQHIKKNGYFEVTLSMSCKTKFYLVHRLVWSAFNGPIPEGMQINHNDEVKTNNNLENLSLMTPKENTNWGTHNERMSKTKQKWVIKLSQNNEILHFYPSVNKAREETGINNIASCCRGVRNYAGGYKWKYAE